MKAFVLFLMTLMAMEVPVFAQQDHHYVIDSRKDCSPFKTENVSQLRIGLSVSEVSKILGRDGIQTMVIRSRGSGIEMVDWCDKHNIVVVVFRHGISSNFSHRKFE